MAGDVIWDDESDNAPGVVWDETRPLEVAPEASGRPDARPRQPYDPLESGAMGFAEGATLGGSGEIAGLGGAAVDQLGRAARATGIAKPLERKEYGGPTSQTSTLRMRGQDGQMNTVSSRTTREPSMRAEDPEVGLLDSYRTNRDQYQRMVDDSREANPAPFMAGELGGGIATQFAMGPGAMTSKGLAAAGGASGFLGSSEDATRPSYETYRNLADETANSAGVSLVLGKSLEGAGNRISKSKLAQYFGQKVDDATAKIAQLAKEAWEERAGTATSEFGNKAKRVHTAMRELAEKQAQGRMLPDEAEKYARLLQDPKIQELDRSIIKNSLQNVEDGPASVGKARDTLRDLTENKDAHINVLRNEIDQPWTREISPRLATYLPPAIGSVVGTVTGQTLLGAGAGGLAGYFYGGGKGGSWGQGAFGALAGAGLRPTMRALYRMVTSPSVTKAWASGLEATMRASPEILGRFGPVLAAAAQRHGSDGVLAMDHALTESDPEYVQLKASLLGVSPDQEEATNAHP